GASGGVPRGTRPGIGGAPDIRVRLMTTRPALTGGAVAGTGGATGGVMVYLSPVGSAMLPARMTAPVTVRLTATQWEVRDRAGLLGRFARTADLEIGAEEAGLSGAPLQAGAGGGGNPGGGGNAVAGRVRAGGVFDVIEIAGLESYLEGVVAAELFADWPLGAYQAQAVAARSYALHERARSRAAGAAFDVEAGVSDQAYRGAVDAARAVAAVRDTRGVVLTWAGEVLRAYFSSTSGGRPASARDTWPTGRGFEYNLVVPLQAAAREEMGRTAKWYRWTVSRSRGELTARFAAWGRVNGHPLKTLTASTPVESVRVEASNAVGRPTRYLVAARGGFTTRVTAEELRRACNEPAAGFAAVNAETMVRSGDVEFRLVGDVFTIAGRGFGHGVGLCQWSAKEMADRGKTWQQIVPVFFPGAQLQRVY
ncbi:MAG: SpoIID/LytB domain-containing protein, partial [bacterium]